MAYEQRKLWKFFMKSIGVYDWAVSKVKGEAELISLFKQDFQSLMRLCAEGV